MSSELIHENPYWQYNLDKYVLPSGRTADYFYVHSRGSVMLIPKLDNDAFIMVKQYRYLNQKESIEFPGGGCEKNLSYEENALKELAEETGYRAGSIKMLSEYNPCNGITDEICRVYLADELQPYSLNADESEKIEIIKFTYNEINNAIKNKLIWDGMSLAAWSIFNIYWKKDEN